MSKHFIIQNEFNEQTQLHLSLSLSVNCLKLDLLVTPPYASASRHMPDQPIYQTHANTHTLPETCCVKYLFHAVCPFTHHSKSIVVLLSPSYHSKPVCWYLVEHKVEIFDEWLCSLCCTITEEAKLQKEQKKNMKKKTQSSEIIWKIEEQTDI